MHAGKWVFCNWTQPAWSKRLLCVFLPFLHKLASCRLCWSCATGLAFSYHNGRDGKIDTPSTFWHLSWSPLRICLLWCHKGQWYGKESFYIVRHMMSCLTCHLAFSVLLLFANGKTCIILKSLKTLHPLFVCFFETVFDSGGLSLKQHVLACFQHLRGPRRAAKRLPGRGAALTAGGDHRGDPQKLHLLLRLGALHHGPLPDLQGPCGQRWVWLGSQLVIVDWKQSTAYKHT